MKLLPLLAAAFALSTAVSAADKLIPKDDHTPLHGGIVVEAADTDFEMVAKSDLITIYVRDHGKPAATQGGSGKVTLLSGSEKTEATLTPAGGNKLAAKGNFKVSAGTKVVAAVTLQGKKPINVRFAIT